MARQLSEHRSMDVHHLKCSNDLYADLQAGHFATLRQRAEQDGYLYLPGFVPTTPILALREQALSFAFEAGWLDEYAWLDGVIKSQFKAVDDQDAGYLHWLGHVMQSEAFSALGHSRQIIKLFEVLFGCAVETQCGDICRMVFPSKQGLSTRAHQDASYIANAQQLWTLWLPLGDCPMSLGPIALLPRSHRRGLQQHQGQGAQSQGISGLEEADWASHDFALGDVLLFHSLTIHCAWQNSSVQRVRLSADYRYRPLHSRPSTISTTVVP